MVLSVFHKILPELSLAVYITIVLIEREKDIEEGNMERVEEIKIKKKE